MRLCAGRQLLLACAFCAPAAASPRLTIHGTHLDIERRALDVRGVPILSRASVVVETHGARHTARQSTPAAPSALAPGMSAAGALDRARQAIEGAGIAFAGARRPPTLALLPTPGGARLVWQIDGRAAFPGADPVPAVLLDAQDGQVLALWNAVRHFDRARVYPENPVATPVLPEVVLGTDPSSTHVSSALLATLDCVDQHDTRPTPLGVLHLCHLLPVAERDQNGDFLIAPAADSAPEDPFAEVQAFYSATHAWELFAGFGLEQLRTEPLPLVVNLMLPAGLDSGDTAKMSDPSLPLTPFAGAAYRTGSVFGAGAGVDGPAIWLGQGPAADMAYDGDVVSHELVHAVVDSTVRLVPWLHADDQGLVGSPSALNEGLADYFAGVLGGNPHIGEYAGRNLGLSAMREISGEARCPDQLVGEPHADSLILSRALWSVRVGLKASAQSAFDEAVFDALVSLPDGNPGFEDFAERLLSVVDASGLGPMPSLRSELSARGLYPTCRRELAWSGAPMDAPVVGGRYVAPGLYDSPWANNGRPAPLGYAPGIVQFLAEVPADTQAVTLRFKAWGDGARPRILFGTASTIRFDWSAPDSNADLEEDARSDDGLHFEARLVLPGGTQRVYAMLVNRAPLAFTYGSVDFSFEAKSPVASTGGPTPGIQPAGGCSCRQAPGSPVPGALVLLALALGWSERRRWQRKV